MSDASDDFLEKMDAGDLDQNLTTEIRKLSQEQLGEVAKVLMSRDSEPMKCNERILLLEHCADTMHVYTRASIKWQKLTGLDNTLAYQYSRSARETARIQADLATWELEQHERVHHCHPATATATPN